MHLHKRTKNPTSGESKRVRADKLRDYCKRPILWLPSSKILTPHPPHRPASVYPPPLVRGEDTLARRRGGGGSIFWKTSDTALYSTYVSTLWLIISCGRWFTCGRGTFRPSVLTSWRPGWWNGGRGTTAVSQPAGRPLTKNLMTLSLDMEDIHIGENPGA